MVGDTTTQQETDGAASSPGVSDYDDSLAFTAWRNR